MPDEPETTEPEQTPPPASESAPQWAQDLKQALEELPGKLRASVSDEDKTSIAEHVHGLFERSGAFERPQPAEQAEQETETEVTETEHETEPKKRSGLSSFAARFEGGE